MTLTILPVRRRHQQIGLARKEGGDLQDIHRLRHRRALVALMHIGQHRQVEILADVGKDRQRVLKSHAARRRLALERLALSKLVL